MAAPSQSDLILYTTTPLGSLAFKTDFLAVIDWICDGSYDLTVSKCTVSSLNVSTSFTFSGAVIIHGSISATLLVGTILKAKDSSGIKIVEQHSTMGLFIQDTTGYVGVKNSSPAHMLDVTGDLSSTTGYGHQILENGHQLVPANLITLWHGSIATIPTGWALCDGTNGTPDLSGRFIVGYSASDSDYSIGFTGGEKAHVLTIPELPAHTHTLPRKSGGGGGHNLLAAYSGSTTSTVATLSTGSDDAHENRPPYYVLAFIMKL